MSERKHWSLGTKLFLIATPFGLLTLAAIVLTLWVSWQLEGGAAAVNEAGRLRMQTYRLALSLASGDAASLPEKVDAFERDLALMRNGDPARPLFMPWDDTVRARFAAVERDWTLFKGLWKSAAPMDASRLREQTAGFAAHIENLVESIEGHMARWTGYLQLLQTTVLGLAVVGMATLILTGYRFVLEPVAQLKEAMRRVQAGDFGTRVHSSSRDEFGMLAAGFDDLATHLESMYHNLEAKVLEKTSELHEKRERLQALYDITALRERSTTLEELATGFTQRVMQIAHADAIALRWSDEGNQRYFLLASQGLPQEMVEAEQCIVRGDCACGDASAPTAARVIPIRTLVPEPPRHCANFRTLVTIPVRFHDRTMGEVDLFYDAEIEPTPSERSLLEALTATLATAMENLRLDCLAKEAAVSHERNLLARELHDSIAQSLAFLKFQVQMMHDALSSNNPQRIESVLGEIDAGVRECYGDVRELLVHFRTRTNEEDIETALQTTLRKFQHQSGVKASLQMKGHGIPIRPDIQVQVLHIVQEALSNVRKHACATQVWLDVQQHPHWRFEVRDDGGGFAPERGLDSETHVGMRIMAERAERIGASVAVTPTIGRGTSVVLDLHAGAYVEPAVEGLAR